MGKNNLKLGYLQGNFKPEKYWYNVRTKEKDHYTEIEVEDYINSIEDYYVRTAYEELINKYKSFYKEIELDIL